jgi:hypothetical protein
LIAAFSSGGPKPKAAQSKSLQYLFKRFRFNVSSGFL